MANIAIRKKLYFLVVAAFATALLIVGGCVPSEEDFIADHPLPLVCPSSLSGSGGPGNPAQLGTAPVCFEPAARIADIYYAVTVPNTGVWNFQVVNMTADFDIVVYSGTSFTDLTILCDSSFGGTTNDVCTIDLNPAGLGGILVENFTGSSTALYRLEVVQ